MKITHRIKADLQIRSTPPRLAMVQCDADSREIEITLTSGGAAWIPAELYTVMLQYRKSDGTGGSYDTQPDGTKAWSVEENRVTVGIANQMLTVPGLVEVQAVLRFGSGRVATFAFQIVVEADMSTGVIESEDYINWSEWAKAELYRVLERAKESGDFMGACFLPAVDAEGNLSWSNDAGMANPDPVNIADLVAGKINGDILQGDMLGHLNMNGFRICSLAEPQDDSDAATKGYAKELVGKLAAGNLLDNSDFRNPVNQRGRSEYANSNYTIDRWKWTYAVSTRKCIINEEGLHLENLSASTGYFAQYFEAPLTNPPYTIAVRENGVTYAYTVHTLGNEDSLNLPGGLVYIQADGTSLCFAVNSGSTVSGIEWIAVYEGEYTADSLPAYKPKGYAAELAECQRYYQIRSANNIPAVDLRPVMRLGSPTITSVSNGYAYSADL